MKGLGSMLGKSHTMENRFADEECKTWLRRLGRRREERFWKKEAESEMGARPGKGSTITCPHCRETWTYQGDDDSTTAADDAWLDRHFDACQKFPGRKDSR